MIDAPSTALLPDQVDALHTTMRKWSGHIPQNLSYVDLLFTFVHAEMGESSRAAQLVGAARTVMKVPVSAPTGQSYLGLEAVTSAVVANFLFKAFKYRIDQATGNATAGRSRGNCSMNSTTSAAVPNRDHRRTHSSSQITSSVGCAGGPASWNLMSVPTFTTAGRGPSIRSTGS
jgi:hypothetical protein